MDGGECYAVGMTLCGALTLSYDNFMQTQLKLLSSSFFRDVMDETLADITCAKHIILL